MGDNNIRHGQPNHRLTAISIAVLLALSVAACGGGGGGGGGPSVGGDKPDVSQPDTGESKPTSIAQSGIVSNSVLLGWQEKPSSQPIDNPLSVKEELVNNSNGIVNQSYRQIATDKKAGLTGKDTILGIVDNGFIPKAELNRVMPVGNMSQALHGTQIATIVSGHSSQSQIHISGAATSTFRLAFEGAVALHKNSEGKIKVVNNSWGDGKNETVESATTSLKALTSTMNNIKTADLLMVMSAGNHGRDNSNATAFMPKIHPDLKLEGNFLTVSSAAYNYDTKQYSDQRDQSVNACGDAKDWCVIAPGFAYGQSSTSYSAAYVTGVLGNVYSRYPWMSASNLQQTILGTASQTSANADTGWGLVNASAAANGYGQFAWDNIVFNLPNQNWQSEFDNNITGKYGFTKTGAGVLVLNGDNTFTGKGIVDQGILVLNGANTASFVVGNNGILAVGDRLQSVEKPTANKITNYGTVKVMESDLFVQDFEGSKESDIVFGTTKKLYVKNKVTGKLDIKVIDGTYQPLQSQKTNTHIVANSITDDIHVSSASNLSSIAGYEKTVKDGQETVEVTTQRNSAADAIQIQKAKAFTSQAASADLIDQALLKIDGDYVANGKLSTQANQFYQLVSNASLNNALFGLSDSLYKNTSDNLNIERSNMVSALLDDVHSKQDMWVSGGYSNAHTNFLGITGKKENYSSGLGAQVQAGKGRIFGQVENLDLTWEDRLSAGVRNKSTTKGYGATVGYWQELPQNWNITVAVGGAHVKNKLHTAVDERSNYDANQYFMVAGMSRLFALNKWLFKPEGSMQYTHLKNNNSQGNLTSAVDSSAKQWTAKLGLAVAYRVSQFFSLQGKASVERDVNRRNNLVMLYADYPVNSDNSYLPKTRYQAQVGALYQPAENWSIYGNYQYSGSNNWNENSARVGLRYLFK